MLIFFLNRVELKMQNNCDSSFSIIWKPIMHNHKNNVNSRIWTNLSLHSYWITKKTIHSMVYLKAHDLLLLLFFLSSLCSQIYSIKCTWFVYLFRFNILMLTQISRINNTLQTTNIVVQFHYCFADFIYNFVWHLITDYKNIV